MALAEGDAGAQVSLGETLPFSLGPVSVEPAARQIRCGEQVRTLEPRVMQVLVALARAEGEVVSRDALIAACWGGLTVGDNAIYRTVSQLRELVCELAPGSVVIDTIARVGYRLRVAGPAAEATVAPPPSVGARPVRWRLWAGALVALLVLAAGAAAWRALEHPATPVLVVRSGQDGAGLARAVADDLPQLLPGRAVAIRRGVGASSGDFVAEVSSAGQAGGGVRLLDRNADEIWSTGAEADAGPRPLAHRLAAALGCALDARHDGLDAGSLRVFVAACVRAHDLPDESVVAALRELVHSRPTFALGWAWLAWSEAVLADQHHSDAGDEALRRAAAGHVVRAEALGVRPGFGFLVRAELTDGRRARERLELIDQGIAADPGLAELHLLKASQAMAVGWLGQSIESARTAVALDPANPAARSALVLVLAYGGRGELAAGEVAKAAADWPASRSVHDAKVHYDIRFGDAAGLLSTIERGAFDDGSSGDLYIGRYRLLLVARAAPTDANIKAVIASVSDTGADAAPVWQLQGLAQFGRVEQAVRLLEDPRVIDVMSDDAGVLFRPYMRAVRDDPRFMRAAVRIGLVRVWRETGHWPDFCGGGPRAYDCRAEAARAEAALAAEGVSTP